MSIKKQAIKSVLANYVGYLFHAIISLIATPIIVHSLGKAQYGIWALVISMTGYYGLLKFGVRSALTKYIAEYNANNDKAEINRLINSSFIFFAGIALAVLLITFFISIYFGKMFLVDNVDVRIIRIVVILVGLNIAVSFIFQPFDTVLVAFNRFDISNTVGITSSIVRTVFIIVVLKMGYGLIAMAVIILFTDVITFGVITTLSKKVFRALKMSIHFITKPTIRKLFSFGLFNFMRQISRVVLERTDAVVIGIFLGPSFIAVYSIAESLISYTGLITKGISRVTLPVSSELNAFDSTEKIRNMMILLPKYILPIASFIFIQFYYIGDQFIGIWLGKGFHQTYIVFCVLMIARLGIMSHETMISSVVGMGHNKFVGYLSVVEAVGNILLSLYFIKLWGIIGVALGTVIPLTITRAFIIPVYCCKLVNIKWKTYFQKVLSPTLFCILPCILTTYIMTEAIPPTNYARMLIVVFSSGVVFMLFFYGFLEPELKLMVRNFVTFKYMNVRRT